MVTDMAGALMLAGRAALAQRQPIMDSGYPGYQIAMLGKPCYL
jgi:hypothetical protein